MLRKLAQKWHSVVLALLFRKRFGTGAGEVPNDEVMGLIDHGHDQQVAGGGFVSPSKQQHDVELCALVATNQERHV